MHEETMIDCWFLSKFLNLLSYERELEKGQLTEELYTQGQAAGLPGFHHCAAVGPQVTLAASPPLRWWILALASLPPIPPYFYATYDTEEAGGEDEALEFIGKTGRSRR